MFKKYSKSVLVIFIVGLLIITLCNLLIVNNAKGKLYSNENEIPYNKVGLLLGTSKLIKNKWHNLYYDYRIDATVKLFKAEKIKYVVISGDNGRKEYNEPEQMRTDLIVKGIDSTKIFLDYAGFRTFDSVKRLKEIFGQNSVTIISQKFHNERALYIASHENINAIAFNAKDVSKKNGFKTQVREKFARVKVFIDYLIHTKPKFLGEKINIPA